MKLRKYRKEDSAVICGWIRDEESLYKWSADRIGIFPLPAEALNDNYAPVTDSGWFFPVTAVDEEDRVIGHLFIRYPDAADRSTVRFGFVIVDPALRGRGFGKEMLRLAMEYAVSELKASRITLGVFANNPSARACYEAVGFRPAGKTILCKMPAGEWECIELEYRPS